MNSERISTPSAPMHDLERWMQKHDYVVGNQAAERGTRWVLWITLATMGVEILAGWWFNSMAVLADGWHMSSHALAIGLSTFAYAAARQYARDPRFAFGTWKIEVLAGYTSALFLLGVAALMVFGSLERLWQPAPIQYAEAMGIAAFGLFINLACALILGHSDHGHEHHHHGHDHGHTTHGHDHHPEPGASCAGHPAAGHDLNLKAAYIHVLTDALTSVLAILALAGGWLWGWAWLDPAMGLLGALLVGLWAKGLLAETGRVLLDREMDHPIVDKIRAVIAELPGQTTLTDLHVWRVGSRQYACTLSVLTHEAKLTPLHIREALGIHAELGHVSVEVHHCDQCPP